MLAEGNGELFLFWGRNFNSSERGQKVRKMGGRLPPSRQYLTRFSERKKSQVGFQKKREVLRRGIEGGGEAEGEQGVLCFVGKELRGEMGLFA